MKWYRGGSYRTEGLTAKAETIRAFLNSIVSNSQLIQDHVHLTLTTDRFQCINVDAEAEWGV